MIYKLCSVDKGAFIIFKAFFPSTLSHYDILYVELNSCFCLKCSEVVFMWNLFAFIPVSTFLAAFPLRSRWASSTFFVRVFFLQTPAFIKGQASAAFSPGRAILFFMGQLLTDSVIQQKLWNKKKKSFHSWTPPHFSAILLKVDFDHAILKRPSSAASAWITPRPCFIKMSAAIQIIIYYWVSAHLLAGKHRIQKLSH